MLFSRKPPKVKMTSGFIDRDGRFKCAGSLAHLPFNPNPYNRIPHFRVNFNGKWITVEVDPLEGASDRFGWIATALPDNDDPNIDVSPRVTVRKD